MAEYELLEEHIQTLHGEHCYEELLKYYKMAETTHDQVRALFGIDY